MKKPITKCPHCGSSEGIYTIRNYIGVLYNIGFHGEEQYNGEMFDNVDTITGGKIAYCQDCDKQICHLSTLEKQWEEVEDAPKRQW